MSKDLKIHINQKRDINGRFKNGNLPWNTGKKRLDISKERNWNWRGGKAKHSNGYILILEYNHPFSNHQGYIFEHRLIMEKHLGRYLKPEEQIHHINGIKTDNRIENLQLFENHTKHMKFEYPKGAKFGIHKGKKRRKL